MNKDNVIKLMEGLRVFNDEIEKYRQFCSLMNHQSGIIPMNEIVDAYIDELQNSKEDLTEILEWKKAKDDEQISVPDYQIDSDIPF